MAVRSRAAVDAESDRIESGIGRLDLLPTGASLYRCRSALCAQALAGAAPPAIASRFCSESAGCRLTYTAKDSVTANWLGAPEREGEPLAGGVTLVRNACGLRLLHDLWLA